MTAYYYAKSLTPEQSAGLPLNITHAVYRDEAGLKRLVALCLSEQQAEYVRDAIATHAQETGKEAP